MSTSTSPLRLHDPQQVRTALRLLYDGGMIAEIRVLEGCERGSRYVRQFYGYFDNGDDVSAALDRLSSAKGIYFSLNPVKPALLSRAHNRLKAGEKGSATLDDLVLQRRWLLVDFDAARPSEISATDEERTSTFERAEAVRAWLREQGWPEPLFADSGNGAHLLYRIDLPNDPASLLLCERSLKALGARFSDPADQISAAKHGDAVWPPPVEVDEKLFNASRICKLYGTLACKGDSTPDRPHRMSGILEAPEQTEVVPLHKLEALAAEAPQAAAPVRPPARLPQRRDGAAPADFDLAAWVADHLGGMVGAEEPWKGGTGRRWTFRVCPYDDGHDRGEASIEQLPSGAISAGCHHSSCTWGWHELRERFEPGCYDRKGGAESLATPGAANAVAAIRERIERIPEDSDPLLLVAQQLPEILDLLVERPNFEIDSYLEAIKQRWPKLSRQQIGDMRKAVRRRRKAAADDTLGRLLRWKVTEGGQTLLRTVHNLASLFRHHEDGPRHWYNDFEWKTYRIMADGSDRPVEDNDYNIDREWLSRCYDVDFSMDMVARTIEQVAKESRRNPLVQYLDGLAWDGEQRIDAWLVRSAGAQDTALNREIGRKFLVGAVARAMQPGCQMDSTLILVGEQGAGKSTLFRKLAGDVYFSDSKVDLTANLKDAYQLLADVWMVEFAELFAFKRADAEGIKSFLTSRTDRFRPSYGRNTVTMPRHCVFCGTTNDDEFLRDPSGSRRFWCVRVADSVDVGWVEDNRDQLWAEAVHAYRSSAGQDFRWWLTPEAEQQRIAASQEFEEYDPWTEEVLEYIHGRDLVQISGVTEHIKEKHAAQEGWHTTHRVTAILRRQGWSRKSTRKDGKVCKCWHPPDDAPGNGAAEGPQGETAAYVDQGPSPGQSRRDRYRPDKYF